MYILCRFRYSGRLNTRISSYLPSQQMYKSCKTHIANDCRAAVRALGNLSAVFREIVASFFNTDTSVYSNRAE